MRSMPALALLCVLGLLLPLLTDLAAESANALAWLIDLASHWQWLFLSGLVFSVSIAVCFNRRWAVLLLAVPLPWLTASAQAPASFPDGAVLTMASANVNLGNRDVRPLATWLSEEQVDVVAVYEVSIEYSKELEALAEYPFKRIVPRDSPFGIGLLSRHPLLDAEVLHDKNGVAHIEARVQWQGQSVTVVAMHPMPPISPEYQAVRDGKLRTLASTIGFNSPPTILAGDLNATPWSSAFSGLADMGLRRATGLAPSWPAEMRGVLGIPIDHLLVTSHWVVASSEQGPDIGSDHFPVLARLFLQDSGDGIGLDD